MLGMAVEAWEFDDSCDLGDVVEIVTERLAPPSFAGHLLSSHGDSLTVQLTSGTVTGSPRSLYYVRGRGSFVIGRTERWPAAPGGRPRLLVTLLAFPQPTAVAGEPARR